MRKLADLDEPKCSEGCQAKFNAVHTVMEHQAAIIRELQHSMKQVKESQQVHRERYRRLNWNINELFDRADDQSKTQHTHKASIAALKSRVPANDGVHFR